MLCAVIGLLPTPAHAQTAELRGIVADGSGAVLPGVTVTILNEATGVDRTIVTDNQGSFRAPALQPGTYTITSELMGFGPDLRRVTMTVGEVAELRIGLSVGGLAETVEVTASAVTIETTKSDLSGVVTQEQVAELPVLNRGFVGLAQLLPGGGPARTADARFGIQTAFGGTNVRSMYSIQIDGGIMDHPIYGFAIVNVNQDAVQEFRVLRNQFDTEYSRAGTAIVNVLTRSGTNTMRGQLSYFGRDDSLNAKNAFAQSKPPFDSTRVSGTLGGPIARNRAFFFGALEYVRQNSVRIIALPPANPFAGGFNGVYGNGNRGKLGQAKVDYTVNPRHALSVRYLYTDEDIFETYQLAENTALDFSDVSGHWNWTLGSSMLNSVVVQVLDASTPIRGTRSATTIAVWTKTTAVTRCRSRRSARSPGACNCRPSSRCAPAIRGTSRPASISTATATGRTAPRGSSRAPAAPRVRRIWTSSMRSAPPDDWPRSRWNS